LGQRLVEVTEIRVPPDTSQVPLRTTHCRLIDVDGVQLERPDEGGQRDTDRTATAAQVDHDRQSRTVLASCPVNQRGRQLDQQAGPSAGHEHPRFHHQAQATELSPAEYLFQWLSGRPALHQGGQLPGAGGRLGQQQRLVLCEHAAGGPQPGGHGTIRRPATTRQLSG
jgi:hypothetical protein